MGFTVYPGLMWTAALVHWALNALSLAVSVRHVCVFLVCTSCERTSTDPRRQAPWMASNATIAIYLLGKEVKDSQTGLLAAGFMALVPGSPPHLSKHSKYTELTPCRYISRSVAGSFDNEGVAVFAMLTTFYFFVKSVNTGSLGCGAMSAVAYFYMAASWGGYVYVINIIPLYVIVLVHRDTPCCC